MIHKHFRQKMGHRELKPTNYEALMDDVTYKNMVMHRAQLRKLALEWKTKALADTEALIEIIATELKQKKISFGRIKGAYMIKFFSKIRRRLLTENKLSKYLIYALGEIFLVVVGILIALQINNWNEWRKDRVREKIILDDLAKNIEINIRTFQNDKDSLQPWNHSSAVVIHALENKMDYSDTLKLHFHLARVTKQELFLSNMGYQAYKDQGLDIIMNRALSTEIVKLYEGTIPSTLSTNSLVNQLYPPFDNHNVQNLDFVEGEELAPNDYESLFSNHFYISWIKAYSQGRISLIATVNILIKECESIKKLIREELEQKQKQ